MGQFVSPLCLSFFYYMLLIYLSHLSHPTYMYVTPHVFFILNIVCLHGLDGVQPTSRPLRARGSASMSALDRCQYGSWSGDQQ